MSISEFYYKEPYELCDDSTEYYLLTRDHITHFELDGTRVIKVGKEGIIKMARAATRDCSFMLRRSHIEQLAMILDDPKASQNDKYVALSMLRNADISSRGVLPLCQDTGTVIITGRKGQQVWTGYDDAGALSLGVYETYRDENLRYSQVVPLDMYNEVNTSTNLPAQVDIYATPGDEYSFLFIAKGGGSANKTALFQETKAILNPEKLEHYLTEKLKLLGTSACPPYHVAFVIGGTSAEACLRAVKLASAKYLDDLPAEGNKWGQAFRDKMLENRLLEAANKLGIGAQFGGKYFALDVRVIRLPRHSASCPIGMGVSCVADRHIKTKINKDGIWVEKLENNPGRFISHEYMRFMESGSIHVDLERPLKDILQELSKYPIGTRLLLTGTIVVCRDTVHSKLKEKLDFGKDLPGYIKDHPVYYAGPARTPTDMASGSFGPTTAGRMDTYVDLFQKHGGSLIMIAKGNRSHIVAEACKRYGGFYLGSIGGPAALLAHDHITRVEPIDYIELGMEAVFSISVKSFPVFMLIDDKGNDFYLSCIKSPLN